MATLTVTRNYADSSTLTEAQLDAAFDSVETFLNSTKINSDNIQSGGISAANLASSSVTETKIDTGAVSTAKLADGAVTTVKITDSNVTTAKIADSNVTTAKIADSNVTTDKIADSNVTTDKIADLNVTTAKINDSAVTTSKINDGAVTQAKRVSLGQQVSSSSGNFDTTSTSATDVTNLSVSITTTGRPVFVGLISGAHATIPSKVGVSATSESSIGGRSQFLRDSTSLGMSVIQSSLDGSSEADALTSAPGAFWTIDTPGAGTYTYKFQAWVTNASVTMSVTQCKLVAYEL